MKRAPAFVEDGDGRRGREPHHERHRLRVRVKIAPSGERIIISRRPTRLPADSDRMELWSIAADGSAPLQLTSNSVPEEDGELAPDGSQVLFIARANHRQQPYYNANLFLVPASGGTARALMPDFPNEVLRAGWAVDGKSIWMIVNTGVRIDLFEVDLASPKPRQVTRGDHALVPPFWSTVAGRHVFMIDEPTRIGDIYTWAPGEESPASCHGHLRLPRSRLRPAASGTRRMEGKRRHSYRRSADLSARLQAGHTVSADRAASWRARGVGSIRVGLDLLLLSARLGGARLRHPAAELPRQLRLRQRVLSRAGRRLLQEQPPRRSRRRRSPHFDGQSPIPIASR